MKLYLLSSISLFLLTGCVSIQEDIARSYKIQKTKNECQAKGADWKIVEIYVDGSGLCINKITYELEQKTREEQREKIEKEANQERLDHLASYEKNYLSEYNNILKNTPKDKTTYIQPMNKKEPCKIWIAYQENDKWFKCQRRN